MVGSEIPSRLNWDLEGMNEFKRQWKQRLVFCGRAWGSRWSEPQVRESPKDLPWPMTDVSQALKNI